VRRRPITVLVIACALGVPAVADASGSERKALPPRPVVGAGTINVPTLKAYARPAAGARVVGTLPEFRPQDFRPFAVLAIARKLKNGSPAWYKISLPGRPNGRTGWVRAQDIDIRPMPWQVVVLLEQREVQLWKGDQLVKTGRVAIGARGMETPTGLYYVTMRFKPVRQTFLGSFAFETSAYSKLSEWPGGGVVGLHGTTRPELLGQAVSHGCVRLSNELANFLRDRIPVGTPIRIV
jgi:lipoprotein-anchoring transpeptidase ErfK/SrfK